MKKTKMLKKNYEFKNVLARGKFFVGEQIEVVLLKNHTKHNYLGIAVSTKNGKAFQRNRCKRLIRESYKNLENTLIEGNNIVILIRRKTDIKEITYKHVIEDMKKIFEKAKIVKKEEEI